MADLTLIFIGVLAWIFAGVLTFIYRVRTHAGFSRSADGNDLVTFVVMGPFGWCMILSDIINNIAEWLVRNAR